MKKILLFCLLSSAGMFAQENVTLVTGKTSEVRLDLLSPIAFGKANVSYEYFTGSDFSYGITLSFAFGKKTDEDFENGYRKNLPQYEVIPYVRYKLSKSELSYYFAEVFASANSGKVREIVRIDQGGTAAYVIDESTYSDLALGGGLGYKFYMRQWAVEFAVGAGYNLLNTDQSPDVITRVGLNLGYRF